MGDMEIPDELIDQLLGEYQGPEQLTGPDGLINQLRRRLIERAAGAELEQHLGYRPGAEPPEAAEPAQRDDVEDVADRRRPGHGRAATRPRRLVRAADRAQAR